jgi:hypothetical protein
MFHTQLSEDDKLLQHKEEEMEGLFATLLRVVEKHQLLNAIGQCNIQNINIGND